MAVIDTSPNGHMLSPVGSRARRNAGDAMAAVCVFGSLILFAIRVRGESAPISVGLENLLLLVAFMSTANARRLRWLLLAIALLSLHRMLTLPLVWRGSADLGIAVEMLAVVFKCLMFAVVVHALSVRSLLAGTLTTTTVVLSVFVGRLLLGLHIDPDNSFAGGMADRNYMALLLAFLLFSAVMLTRSLRQQGRSRSSDEVWLFALHVAALLLVLRSGSRSGLLSCLVSLWLFSPRAALAAMPLGVGILLTTDIASFLTKRLDRLDTQSQEEFVRLAQLIAAWSRIEETPLGLMTGFGVMASHHLTWFERGFALTGLDEYLTVVHNSLVDFVLGFGLIGAVVVLRMARRVTATTVIFFLASTSFINVLAFVPFYLAIAVTAKVGARPSR